MSRMSVSFLVPFLVSRRCGTMNVLETRALVCTSHAKACISDSPYSSSRRISISPYWTLPQQRASSRASCTVGPDTVPSERGKE
jgi:hypothetical protein